MNEQPLHHATHEPGDQGPDLLLEMFQCQFVREVREARGRQQNEASASSERDG